MTQAEFELFISIVKRWGVAGAAAIDLRMHPEEWTEALLSRRLIARGLGEVIAFEFTVRAALARWISRENVLWRTYTLWCIYAP